MKPGLLISLLIVGGVFAIGLFSTSVSAGGPVTVEGTVTDINGNPVRDVEVMALAVDSEVPITTNTKKSGEFSIKLPDSDVMYDVRFSKEGFGVETAELQPTPENLSPLTVVLGPAVEISEAREKAIPVFNEGVTALEAGEKPAALEKFQQASAIDPDFLEAATATAAIAMELEDFAAAADAGENLVRLQPDSLDAISTAYFAELMLLDMERFLPSARRLADADPGTVSSAMVQHATVLFDNNELEGSRALLELVIEKEPELAAAYLQLGLVCNMAGDAACAKNALERYLELAPDGSDAATAQSLLDYLQ
jgi:tetratricopeptide (TPR) repeat protein